MRTRTSSVTASALFVHGFVIDGHFAAVESLDEQIERLEDLLFAATRRGMTCSVAASSYGKSLHLRPLMLPMREAVNSPMRRDGQSVPEQLIPHYQDVYDHVLRAAEWTESLRDLVTTILETNLTIQGDRLNVITKIVTSGAAIIAVSTAITGFYGRKLPPRVRPRVGVHHVVVPDRADIRGRYLTFRRNDWLRPPSWARSVLSTEPHPCARRAVVSVRFMPADPHPGLPGTIQPGGAEVGGTHEVRRARRSDGLEGCRPRARLRRTRSWR